MPATAIGAVILAGLTTTGCAPAPRNTGQIFDHVTAAIAPGFRGAATFGCGEALTLTVIGSGSTISASEPASGSFAMQGGPLAYRGDRGTIDFHPDYSGFTWTPPGATAAPLTCAV
jgi:hypothetical protein